MVGQEGSTGLQPHGFKPTTRPLPPRGRPNNFWIQVKVCFRVTTTGTQNTQTDQQRAKQERWTFDLGHKNVNNDDKNNKNDDKNNYDNNNDVNNNDVNNNGSEH